MLPIVLALIALAVSALGFLPTVNPRVVPKSKVISTVTGISADVTETDEAAGYYEIPRGAENISFQFEVDTNTGFSADTNYFKGYIVGADDPAGTYVRIPGLATGQLTVAGEIVPTAANAPGITLPRFIKVEWDETGTMTSFTARCRIRYDLPAGAGRDASPGYLGG